MSEEIIRKTATLDSATGTADICFTNAAPDKDIDGYAPGWADNARVQGGRAHDLVLGGSEPPAFVADIVNRGSKYDATLYFLDTARGREERETVKALKALGVEQEVSMSFTDVRTGPVPDHLKHFGYRRYITRGTFVEVALVHRGAVPGARITSIKRTQSQTRVMPSDAEQKALMAEVRKKLAPPPVTAADVRRIQRNIERSHAQMVCDAEPPTERQMKEARYWADQACDTMRTGRVRIIWQVDDLKMDGCFLPSEPDAIHLNPRLSLDQIRETAIHESVHKMRHARGLPNSERLTELDTGDLLQVLGAA